LHAEDLADLELVNLEKHLTPRILRLPLFKACRERVLLLNMHNRLNQQLTLFNHVETTSWISNVKYNLVGQNGDLTELGIKVSHFLDGPV